MGTQGKGGIEVDEGMNTRLLLFSIGHGTRSLVEFIDLLKANGVTLLVDVRTIPRSRHNPQFNGDTLSDNLGSAGIGYCHLKVLGELRHDLADSSNAGWRTPAFRGYADYMMTEAFTDGMNELAALGQRERVAIMCAETVPWRCHRSLIADALAVRQISVEHILGPGNRHPHRLTPFARVEGECITYPPELVDSDWATGYYSSSHRVKGWNMRLMVFTDTASRGLRYVYE